MQIAECHCCKVDYHELLFLLGTCLTRFQPRANRAERAVAGGPVLLSVQGSRPEATQRVARRARARLEAQTRSGRCIIKRNQAGGKSPGATPSRSPALKK